MVGIVNDASEQIELVGAEQPHKELVASLGSQRDLLVDIRDALTARKDEEIVSLQASVPFSQHPKLRIDRILVLINGDAANVINAVLTLTIGSGSYLFPLSGNVTLSFPLVIERGADVVYTVAGVFGSSAVYMIGTVE